MDNKNKNDHGSSRKEIMKGPASRASRLKRMDARKRDERRLARFSEWLEQRESLLALAQKRLDMTDKAEPMTDRIYRAGWDKGGEWTCPLCGRMVGKNLHGDRPFQLARQHAETRARIPKREIGNK